MHTAIVFGAPVNIGGLGIQSANAIHATALGSTRVSAFGPFSSNGFAGFGPRVSWNRAPMAVSAWRRRYTTLRWEHGRLQYESDIKIGKWAADQIGEARPDLCYAFTQVALETLRLAKKLGIPSVLESPNGYIRAFRGIYETETATWCGGRYHGHPTELMVARVEEEYDLADHIRVSSEWAKSSLIRGGVAANKIAVLQQPVDLTRYKPLPVRRSASGPLRLLFVGSLDLRKGFLYLLKALKLLDHKSYRLEVVGATGDRCCARLLERNREGLNVEAAPGDSVPAYHRNELFVLPTLEDGSPFAVVEAMASGLPVIVTYECGSAEWIEEGVSGWAIAARSVESLAVTLEHALECRGKLGEMGLHARASTEKRVRPATEATAQWLSKIAATAC